jgi:uncharacterized membrane protein YhiD involved in acid resistance
MIISLIAGAFMLINSLIVLYMPMYTGMPMHMGMPMGMWMRMWMSTGMIATPYSFSVVAAGVISSVSFIAAGVLLSSDARILGAIILVSSLASLFMVGSIIGSLLGIIGGSLALTVRRV